MEKKKTNSKKTTSKIDTSKKVVDSVEKDDNLKKIIAAIVVIALLLIALISFKACSKEEEQPKKDEEIIEKEEVVEETTEPEDTSSYIPTAVVNVVENKTTTSAAAVVSQPVEKKNLVIRIKLPGNLVADGTEKASEIVFEDEEGNEVEITDYTVVYTNEDGTELEGAPTEIGIYTVTVTFGGNDEYEANTATATFEIVKAPIAVSDYDSFELALEEAEDGDTIVVDSVIEDDITIDKSIILTGTEESFIAGKVVVTASDVVIDSVTIKDISTGVDTGKGNGIALVKVETTGDFTFTNNTIESITGKAYNALFINAEGIVTIENNTFGDTDNNIYNTIELSSATPLKDGSSISGNYFANEGNSHNQINIYNFEDGATINLSNNTFEYSANGYRIANIGGKTVNIDMTNNTYNTTDSYVDYAGLICFQPWPGESVDYSNMTIDMTGLTNNSGEEQIYYYYDATRQDEIVEANIIR
ncbi:MAG: hypothetical protein ACI4OT_00665 [Bacilli bacterium]